MNSRTESGLLRLAIAKGLLRWEDLDSVAGRISQTSQTGSSSGTGHLEGRWIRALLDAGHLTPDLVAQLTAELEGSDATPDLTSGSRAWPVQPASSAAPPKDFQGLDLAPEFRFLTVWSRYRVERLLGSGGMGTVYKAFDPTLGRYVALKFLHRNDEIQTQRFLREARAQARIDHPHVCQVHEVGEVEGRPFIAMQYIDGRSLGEMGEELPVEARVRLVRDVARAVHAAHRSGLIHRDLKPGNILIARDETGKLSPYVVDFGLAQEASDPVLTRTGMISGTPAYVSPEQAQGRPLDHRTDVYSLGVVLYELLAGQPPFAGGNLARVLVQLVQEDPKPVRLLNPAIPGDLETIVAKCLEKDPARRYESARDLAEDLDRFLEGDPILARPAGWSYRMGKRLRKNRALATVSAAAVLILIVLGTASLRAQWLARERAGLAQRFGQRIGELETSLRYEAFLPRHDVTPHKRRLRRELDAIQSEMNRLGAVAEGPGNLVLGEGYLALRRYETARMHLEKAWKAGERRPDVAMALGAALSTLYERALGDSSSSANREDLDRAYRQPALSYLREATGNPRSSPYVAALIASLEKRYSAAVAHARQVPAQSPEFYKAAELEAAVYLTQGNEAANSGRYDEALRLYDRAGEVYRRLIARVPSEAGLYAGDCDRWSRWIRAAMARQDLSEAQVNQAFAVCDLALKVDPEMADVLNFKATLFWRLGDQKAKRGIDPQADLEQSVLLAGRAIALDSRHPQAHSQLASSHLRWALWRIGQGSDPMDHLRKSIEAARQAVLIQPELASAHASLGTSYLALEQALQRRGLDRRPAVKKAVASFQKAVSLNPRYAPALNGLGNAWKATSEIEVARGMNPAEPVGKAAAAFERAARLNPNHMTTWNNLGNVHLTHGEYLLTRGDDPRQSLTRAARSYERAIELKPDYFLARFNLAYTYRSLAEGVLDQGEDPQKALDATAAALGEAAKLNSNDADVHLERARAEIIDARWRLRQKENPESALRKASDALRQAEEIDPRYAEAYFTQALVARYRADGTKAPRSQAAALREGTAKVERALAIDPGEARYLALRGLLQYRTARLETDPERRKEQSRQAASLLQEALKANPLLQREYGSILADARLDGGLTAGPPPVKL